MFDVNLVAQPVAQELVWYGLVVQEKRSKLVLVERFVSAMGSTKRAPYWTTKARWKRMERTVS